MCELLVRVEDKVNANCPYLDSKCTKRGDVIVIMNDGHEWSKLERSSPEWIIVKVPNASIPDLESLLVPEPLIHSTDSSNIRQRRAFRLDIDSLEQEVGYKLNKENTPLLELTYKDVVSLRTRVKRLTDPNIVGDTLPGVL